MAQVGERRIVNVGLRLAEAARRTPDAVAVAAARRSWRGKRRYLEVTFAELEADSSRLAAALREGGAAPGSRLVLLVRPGVDFLSLAFALFKAGIVAVLIDPGMGRRRLIRCLAEAAPDGFVAISPAQAVRAILRRRFPQARCNVTAGRRWFWAGPTLAQLRQRSGSAPPPPPTTRGEDPAAVIFTTGSTGPPKGVLYRHENFDRQVDELRDFYGVAPGDVDVAAFPLFALFNAALGVTTVVPEMDATRPAAVDPRNIVEAICDWGAVQAFGSPSLWNVVGRYCEENSVRLPTLRRVLSAGAPVPAHVLRRMKAAIHPEGEMHTPYGATEALPVASITATEVIRETDARSREGGGVCVGRRFPGIEWKIIRIRDDPIERIEKAEELPPGEIGELIVRGPVVTRQYATRKECEALHKIQDGDAVWHRMGDVGYFDRGGDDRCERFWFCGRKSHRVITETGTIYTIPCEAIFNRHPRVYRSALVGVGPPPRQRPVVVVEPWPESRPTGAQDRQRLPAELQEMAAGRRLTEPVRDILLRRSLPVDIRHNAKIFRERLALWASSRVGN